ncbi:MAG: hypothetical protein U0736_27930 [Gemmataceae bacterium]
MSGQSLSLTLLCGLMPVLAAAEPAADRPTGLVRAIKVLPDRAPDCSSLKAIVASVTRGCKTNDEKAIALYNFMRLTHYHRAYPSEPGGIPVLKEINAYGWSLCGGLHAEQSALWRELGWKWRFVGWPGHTTVEAFYDGRWHYLDVFLKFYAWMPDQTNPTGRTIAGQDDLAARPRELLHEAFTLDPARKVIYARGNTFDMVGAKANWQAPAFLVCGDTLADVEAGVRRRNRVGPEEGWGGMRHATGGYSAEVDLAPGFALTNSWDPVDDAWFWSGSTVCPRHTCGDKEIRNSPEKGPVAEPYLGPGWKGESYASGQLDFRPDLSDPSSLRSFVSTENVKMTGGALVPAEDGKPARLTVRLASPYLLTRASGSADGVAKAEVSGDGKTWQTVDLADFSAAVKGRVSALVRLTIRDRLRDLHLRATVQNNPFALPFLSPGKNVVTVSAADPAALGDNRLVVTYAYRTGSRRKSYEQLCLEGKEIARGHDASWDETPTVVQKEFTARDLPARFEVDVPTPKDRYPVYPRMLFVRREVLAPGQKPLPLPAGAKPPRIGPQDELKSLPNPLLTGTQPPPAPVVRPTTTRRIALTAGPVIGKAGALPPGTLLKWPKDRREKVEPVARLLGGELTDLPAQADLAAARLVFPVVRAHTRAPTKLGVAPLRRPPGPTPDLGALGEPMGTVIVPQFPEDAAAWAPAKSFKIDVTHYLRSVIRGDVRHHGFALRVVPDRGVDDGWTVAVGLPPEPGVYLELDVYTGPPMPASGR